MHKFICLILILSNQTQSSNTRYLISPGPVTSISQYPFVAAILSCSPAPNGALACGAFCSGSLIAPNLVLTAGHCVYDESSAFKDPEPPVPLSQMYVLLGSDDSRRGSQGQVLVKVHSFTNKGFGMNVRYPMDGDFAVLHLERCVDLVPGKIETVPVATLDNEPVTSATRCTDIVTLGFGQITNLPDEVAYTDGRLRMLPDALHSFDTCLDSYIGHSLMLEGYDASYLNESGNEAVKNFYNTYLVPEYSSCVGGNSVQSSCNGDSGGPIVAKGPDGKYIQIGTTSFGTGTYCGFGADFIARLAPSADFIRKYMDLNSASCANWSTQMAFSSWPPRTLTTAELSTAYKSSRCQLPTQWQCEDGTCIDLSLVCNKVKNCPDQSDEDSSYCSAVYRRSAVTRSTNGGLTEKQALIQSELDSLIAQADLGKTGPTRLLGETDTATQVILVGTLTSFARPTPKVPEGLAVQNQTNVSKDSPNVSDRIALRAVAFDCSSIVDVVEAKITYEKTNGYNRLEEDPSSMVAACESYEQCVQSRQTGPDGRVESFCADFSQFVAERQQALFTSATFDSKYGNQCAQPPSDYSTPGGSDWNTPSPMIYANGVSVASMFASLLILVVILI